MPHYLYPLRTRRKFSLQKTFSLRPVSKGRSAFALIKEEKSNSYVCREGETSNIEANFVLYSIWILSVQL